MHIMEETLSVKDGIEIPGHEMWFTASRAGGPGGQHVNKTSSRVSLFWDLGNTSALDAHQRARVMRRLGSRVTRDGHVVVHVDETRSQHKNRETARERLAAMIREALSIRKKRIPTRISDSQRRRRIEAKRRRGEKKRGRREPSDY